METWRLIRSGEPPADKKIRVTEKTRERLKAHKVVAGVALIETYEMLIDRILNFLDQIDPDGENMWNWLNYGDFDFQPPKRSRKGRRQDVKGPVAGQNICVSMRTLKKLRKYKLHWADSHSWVIERALDMWDILDPGMRKFHARVKAQAQTRLRSEKMDYELG